MNKQFADMININENASRVIETMDDGSLFKMTETLATAKVKSIDDYIVKQLYEAYKETEVSKIFVIGMEEFEAFLKKMLPLWMEGRK